MPGREKPRVGLMVKGASVLFLTLGSTALVSSAAGAHMAKKPVVFKGHICTAVATSTHPTAVGHARPGHPAVVCGISGNDTLKAKGKGLVLLIAGSGHDTLIASNARGAHDVMIGSTGGDTFVSGNNGEDEIVLGATSGDTIDCSTTAPTTIAGDDSGDDSNGDCQGGNVQNASQEWQGVVTATDGSTTMTVQWSDANDAAQTWLAANGNPASVTFDITTADIQVENGGALAVGDQVDVTADGTTSGIGLVAVSVDAGAPEGEGDSSCSGGSVTGTVQGDLSLTSGSCTISNADIQGDVSIGVGASATISNTTIEGDLSCDGAVADGGGNSVQGDVSSSCPSSIGGGSSGGGDN